VKLFVPVVIALYFSEIEPNTAFPESVSDVHVKEVTTSAPDDIAEVGIPVKLVPVSMGAVDGFTKVDANIASVTEPVNQCGLFPC
jgi:hypothetical protein